MLLNSLRVDSHVHMEILGDASKTYIVQSSTDLRNWTTLATLKADSTGIIEFDAGPYKQSQARFYRTIAPQ